MDTVDTGGSDYSVDFHNTLSDIENQIDALDQKAELHGPTSGATEKVDYIASELLGAIEDNPRSCSPLDQHFQQVFLRVSVLSDKLGSSETQNRLEEARLSVIASFDTKLMEGAGQLLRQLKSAGAGESLSGELKAALETDAVSGVNQLAGYLTEHPQDIPLLMQYGSQEFVEEFIAFTHLAVANSDDDGNTALHLAAESPKLQGALDQLIATGVSVDEPNNDGKTPLDVAVQANNLLAVKALVTAGASVDILRYGDTLSDKPAVLNVLKNVVLEKASLNMSPPNKAILNPPKREGGAGLMMGTIAPMIVPLAPNVTKVAAGIDVGNHLALVHGAQVTVRGYNEEKEYVKTATKNVKLQAEIAHVEERIQQLDVQMEGKAGAALAPFEGKKRQLLQERDALIKLEQSEAKGVREEVWQKAIFLQQDTAKGAAYLLEESAPEMFSEFSTKVMNLGFGTASSAVAIFQNWNKLNDAQEKIAHIDDVADALASAYNDLEALHEKLETGSAEERLVRLKMRGLQERRKEVQAQWTKLGDETFLRATAVIGLVTATSLMAYGAAQYCGVFGEEGEMEASETLGKAKFLKMGSALLPAVGPHVVAGGRWLWNRGKQAVVGEPLSESEQLQRADAKAETALKKKQKKLNREMNRIRNDLEYGYEEALGVVYIPEPGSTEYNELNDRKDEITRELREIETKLTDHAQAQQLGMPVSHFKREVNQLLAAADTEEKQQQLEGALKASGVDTSSFWEDPRGCVIEYLLK